MGRSTGLCREPSLAGIGAALLLLGVPVYSRLLLIEAARSVSRIIRCNGNGVARHALDDARRCGLVLNSSGCQSVVANDSVLFVVDYHVGPGGSSSGRLKCVTG